MCLRLLGISRDCDIGRNRLSRWPRLCTDPTEVLLLLGGFLKGKCGNRVGVRMISEPVTLQEMAELLHGGHGE